MLGGRTLLKWWRAPFWLLALGTGAKSFADNPFLGSRTLNRRGLHAARLKLAHRLAAARRRRLAGAVPADWRDQFDRNGFVEVRDFLPAESFARLQRDLLGTAFESRQHQQGDTVTRRIAVGAGLAAAFPELSALLGNRPWRALLAYVASTRAEPLHYIQTIVTGLPSDHPDPQLNLHSDTFHPSLKAWLFLTDVTDDEGPLTYVAGSHRLTAERLAWERARSIDIARHDRLSQRGSLRISGDELPGMGLPQPTRFAVPANTLVVIDTSGFHARGSSTRQTVRVELWSYARRNPFLPFSGLDLFALPALASLRADWQYWIVDQLDRLGIAKQQWHPAGRKRPDEP
ncbi:MAG TPA: phytanoyl-CoA dioxygenase family protein [Sphingomicrobium sp.]|nr:phytanoyl-CoA dioxygenase family protein [Sphingomicrobium sp.]